MTLRRDEKGFSLIELLIVVAIIGIIATIAVPQLMNALDRGRQKRSMADMRNIASANGTYRVDNTDYASSLSGLEPDYMQEVPDVDAWGTAYQYSLSSGDYTLECYGSDTSDGPTLSGTWEDSDNRYDYDLEMTNGQFTQAPGIES